MTVYVDDFRTPAKVGRINGRWSHLTADTPDELHDFTESFGMRRGWFQGRCKYGACPAVDGCCAHFHYDVTDSVREKAIRAGAEPINMREFGAITSGHDRLDISQPQPSSAARRCVVCREPSWAAECVGCAIDADVVFERGVDQ